MSSPAATSSRILIVDDEPTVVTLVGEMMRVAGHEVCEAVSIASAIQCLQQERLDLVLADIDLPDGSGLDLLRWVAARDLDLDVVMVTGGGLTGDHRSSPSAACRLLSLQCRWHFQYA